MVRELANYDPVLIQAVLRWPLREALVAYVQRLRVQALAEWRHAELCYVSVAPHSTKPGNPPKEPRVLRIARRQRFPEERDAGS
jgi:hypothetical protein